MFIYAAVEDLGRDWFQITEEDMVSVAASSSLAKGQRRGCGEETNQRKDSLHQLSSKLAAFIIPQIFSPTFHVHE